MAHRSSSGASSCASSPARASPCRAAPYASPQDAPRCPRPCRPCAFLPGRIRFFTATSFSPPAIPKRREIAPCWKRSGFTPPEPRHLAVETFGVVRCLPLLRPCHDVVGGGLRFPHRAIVKKISLKSSILMTTVVLVAMLGGAWLAATYRENGSRAILLPDQVMTLLPEPKPLTAFAFTDHENRVFDLSRLKGKWSFLFFGYTHCPDVCPTTLATLARAHENMAKSNAGAEDVQFVFISVDPNRDTAGKLRQYVTYFDASFLGVAGDDAQLGKLAGQLGAVYQVEVKPGAENYPVYHSAAVFLVDPRARYHAVFAPPLDAEEIGRRFEVLRQLDGPKAT